VPTYELGQTLTVQIKVYNSADPPALADLGGGDPTCTVTKPDGTNTGGTVTRIGAGTYNGSLASTLYGRYRFTMTGTGANSGGLPWSNVVDVWPADPRFICSLEDAKAELNIPGSVNVDDDELRRYIAAAMPIVEDVVGRVGPGVVEVETLDGGKAAVLLSQRVRSVTSVVVDGVALTASDYVVDAAAGIIYAGSEGAGRFSWGRQNVVVTYTSGDQAVPANVVTGGAIIAAHLYSVGQMSRSGRGRTDETFVTTGSGFAVPSRALELLGPSAHRSMPGFA
jgi:hypothetical protein